MVYFPAVSSPHNPDSSLNVINSDVDDEEVVYQMKRVRLAESTTAPSLLEYLSHDPNPAVSTAALANPFFTR